MYLTLLFTLIGAIGVRSCSLSDISSCVCSIPGTSECTALKTEISNSIYASVVTDDFVCDTDLKRCTLACVINSDICGSASLVSADLTGASCESGLCKLPTVQTSEPTTTSSATEASSEPSTTSSATDAPSTGCTVDTYDTDCSCTTADTSNCDALASELSTLSAYGVSIECSGDTDGYCTADCTAISLNGVAITGDIICGQQAGALGALFYCDETTSLCVAGTDPSGTDPTGCSLDANDIVGSIMDCDCDSSDATNCDDLQATFSSVSVIAGLSTESVVCDDVELHCTLSCNGSGQDSCDTAAAILSDAGSDATLTCDSTVCRLDDDQATEEPTTTESDGGDQTTTEDNGDEATTDDTGDDANTTEDNGDESSTTEDEDTDEDCGNSWPRSNPKKCMDDEASDDCAVYITTDATVCNLNSGISVSTLKLIIKYTFKDLVKEYSDLVCDDAEVKLTELDVILQDGDVDVANNRFNNGIQNTDGSCPTVDELCSDDGLTFLITSTIQLQCGDCDALYFLAQSLLEGVSDGTLIDNYDAFAEEISEAQDVLCTLGFGEVNLLTPVEVSVLTEDGDIYTATLGDGSSATHAHYLGAVVVVMAVLPFIY